MEVIMGKFKETIFDIVPNLETAMLDSTQIEQICKQQQSLTFDRISKWLIGHSRMFAHGGEMQVAKQIETISGEMLLLSELAIQEEPK
jgi:hypothetical protein